MTDVSQIGTHGDSPQVSLEFTHKLQHNDIIVVGSDGLFDNLDQNQIRDCVRPFVNEEGSELSDVNKVAEAVAQLAYKYSLDR